MFLKMKTHLEGKVRLEDVVIIKNTTHVTISKEELLWQKKKKEKKKHTGISALGEVPWRNG